MEVKAEESLRAKSLRAFKAAHPDVKAVRFSLPVGLSWAGVDGERTPFRDIAHDFWAESV